MLQDLAVPFEDKTPEDVIRRLVLSHTNGKDNFSIVSPPLKRATPLIAHGLKERYPRERGATVKLNDSTIHASSVSDLFRQAMSWLSTSGILENVNPLLPIYTSNKRFLMALKPVHPSGKAFFCPVEHKGYYMEAHKNYKDAISNLDKRLMDKLGVKFEYVPNKIGRASCRERV